jgi:hypothetical protein
MAGIFKAYDIRGSYPDELDEAKDISSRCALSLEGIRLYQLSR